MSRLIVLNGCATIQLSGDKNTLIDAVDCPSLSRYRWRANVCGPFRYATRHRLKSDSKNSELYMHRYVVSMRADAPIKGKLVDHKNRDSMDNRLENLRLADRSGNATNSCKSRKTSGLTSRFKGVFRDRLHGSWKAKIMKNYHTINLGTFATEIDAARAYNEAARKLHGEFACTNDDL